MANDKDFVVAGAVEVGKDTKVTLGSITNGVLQEGYSIANASYDTVSFSVAGQDTEPHGVYFKSDGLKMYVIGNNNDNIYQYTLSTAWDVSTASYDSKSFSTGTQDAAPRDVFLNDDGTKAYVVGSINDTIYEYDLSTAYDISTASYNSVSFSVTSQEGLPTGVFFKPDGTKFWICGQVGDKVNQYSLSTAWDLSTASFDSVTFSVATEDTSPQSLFFKSDGTKMYVTGNINDAVYQYTLSTAWDLSTASYDSVSFDVSSQDGLPTVVFFKDDGTKMYIGGDTNNTIYQYSTTSYADQINLATGNYFADTLAADTTYTLSNAGDVQAFQLEVTGGAVRGDLIDSAYDNILFNLASQSTSVQAIAFNNTGTKFYAGGNDNNIYQYTLSTAWDVSTATYDSISLSISGGLYHLEFKPDGTKLYYADTASTFYEYNLTTPFDISTAVYSTNSFSVSTQTSVGARSITFKTDGTKIYAMSPQNDTVFQYSLSTAWDVSTASYDSISKSVATEVSDNRTIQFTDDGTKMYICDSSSDTVFQYTLSTAWDVSTASYDNLSVNVSVASTMLTPESFKLSTDNDFFYVYGSSYRNVLRFAPPSVDATVTWPSSIEWAGGVAPSAPATGETDVYTLVTDDGGTSYVGVKTADNLS